MRRKRVISLLTALTLTGTCVLGGCGSEPADNEVETATEVAETTVEEKIPDGYTAAPYQVDAELQGPTEYLEPVFYENEGGPTIGVTLVGVVAKDGLYFKDSDNDQELDDFEDWRLDTEVRVADLLTKLNDQQRIGLLENQLMCSPTAKSAEEVYAEDGSVQLDQLIKITEDAMNMPVDAKDEEDNAIYYNSTGAILTYESRSGVSRVTTDAETGALWTNAVNMTTEYAAVAKGEPTIPFTIISNPQNVIGIPDSMGVAAAAMGDGDYSLVEQYADIDRQIWASKGIHRMYGQQIDLITDPRWSRNGTTYSEDPEVTAGIATALVTGYQTGTDGVQEDDVALIMKHFPGDGASYNGFESHYKSGQWRVYQTEGSLENYQLVAFQAAIDAGVAGIMPGYSMQAEAGMLGSVAQSYRGVEIAPELIANAYNTTMLQTLLRDTMGFEGFVNTDSGVIGGSSFADTSFGAEDLTFPERVAAVVNAGSDVIGDALLGTSLESFSEAMEQGLFDAEALDRANGNVLSVSMEMGQFENPYQNIEESKAVVDGLADQIEALGTEMNQKSVVLMKNHDNVLPLEDTAKTVYIASFTNEGEKEETITSWEEAFEAAGYTLVDDAAEADIAFLDVAPGGVAMSNPYMNVIDLVEELGVDEINYPDDTTKTGSQVEVTTLQDVDKIAEISDTVHANGGVVVASINITSPWILTNLEPYCDGLLGTFGTSVSAKMDVLTGAYNPTGKLPLTMVSCNEVIAVEETEVNGTSFEKCVSPNDVPGYDKDQYISEEVLAQSPSGSYAYQDADGNIYTTWFGLSY